MKLYEMTNNLIHLRDVLFDTADEETGEIDTEIATALTVCENGYIQTCENIGMLYREIGNQRDLIKAEIKRLQAMDKTYENRQERIKTALDNSMMQTGTTKIDGIKAKLSYRKSVATVVDNENIIPDEFMRITVKKEPNLTAIKQAIESGKDITFAHLEEKHNLQIK